MKGSDSHANELLNGERERERGIEKERVSQ